MELNHITFILFLICSNGWAAAENCGGLAVTETVTATSGSPTTLFSSVPYCCNSLAKAGLGHRLLYPGQELYTSRIESYWSKAARLETYCILQPINAQEVSLAVTTLVIANKTRPCQFAVRSGGHTTWAGAANIIDGVTIDLGLMNSTVYHPENSTAAVLPGARWKSVYATLDTYGVAVAGGRASTVGVAGLVLGGGNSFYAARKGLVCDNIANFEVVLASGEIINANNVTNSDLFQALKGGSNNFGIVTRLDLEAFDGGNLWGGVVTYPNSTTPLQLEAMVNFGNAVETDPYGSAIGIWQYSTLTNQTIIINAYEYTKPVARPAIFNEYLSIPGNTSDSMRITNMTDITIELEQAPGYRDTFITLTFRNDVRILRKAIELHNILTEDLKSAHGDWNMQNMFQPLPTLFADHGAKKGGNVLGLDRFKEILSDTFFQSKGDWLIRELDAYARSIKKANPFIYLDYAYKTQKPLEGYGHVNVEKIRRAAAKYDPEGVFQIMVPGGFKISKVKEFVA